MSKSGQNGGRCDLNYSQSPSRRPTKGPNTQLERLIGRCERDNKCLGRIRRVRHTSGLLVYFYGSTRGREKVDLRQSAGGLNSNTISCYSDIFWLGIIPKLTSGLLKLDCFIIHIYCIYLRITRQNTIYSFLFII